MKIVLAQELDGSTMPETAFEQSPVRIGRDRTECQLVFESERYPMVSRRHAELRWDAGSWAVVDLGSSYGTYLDGRRIDGPAALDFDSVIQFGTDGPRLRVVWYEVAADSAGPFSAAAPASAPPVPSRAPVSSGAPPVAPAGEARLEFADDRMPPFKLGSASVTLGRDHGCTVVIEGASMVSRRHAEISFSDRSYTISDNNSFNGTLLNGVRMTAPSDLRDGDLITLGVGGPVLRFSFPGSNASGRQASPIAGGEAPKTMATNLVSMSGELSAGARGAGELIRRTSFGDGGMLTIGRELDCDIVLDGLQISNHHARLVRAQGGIWAEDLKSTNGIYVNGFRVSRERLGPEDSLQIGSFVIRIDTEGNVGVFDTRSKTRIDAVNLTKDVRNREGGGKIRLLDGISVSIAPNEFIGLLGPSGAGKSTLMDALNGMRPATEGSVRINGLDLYEHLDSLKQSIGYVPQEDIIHRELTVYKTLFYVAKLRLSRDVSKEEIERIIEEVLDVTDLSDRRHLPVAELSGGQRKRVSIAVELVTKPSVIFLDEPTSGLDPVTEEKIMRLFRQIAESGRTVILTTHAMENVRLFDKVVLMMRGRLIFYGSPEEALAQFGARNFQDLFDKLDDPIDERLAAGGDRHKAADEVAEDWRQKFLRTPQYGKYVGEPLKDLEKAQSSGVSKKRRLGIIGAFRQFSTLTRRYRRVLFRDRMNLAILFGQAPIIALMTFFVMAVDLPRDFVYFVLALVSVWFGTSVAAREMIREKAVYTRERMVNLGLLPYVMSKLVMLGLIVGLQCLMFWLPLKVLDLSGLMSMPGAVLGIPQLLVMVLTACVGIALGLLISALVKTSEMATSLVPLFLIPQILFSGLVGVPAGVSKVAGLAMPAAWSFDSMKRLSRLDTLESEGSSDGKGLYKRIEEKNDSVIAEAKKNVDDSRARLQKKVDVIWEALEAGQPAGLKPSLGDPPAIGTAEKLPQNLSGFVTFKHPWMNVFVNQIVLLLMFGILVLAILVVLRLKDIA